MLLSVNAENYLLHEERIPTELQPQAVVTVWYVIYRLTYSDVPRIGMIVRPYWCWPLVPKFAGSNLAEAVGFLRAKKSSARLPLEGK